MNPTRRSPPCRTTASVRDRSKALCVLFLLFGLFPGLAVASLPGRELPPGEHAPGTTGDAFLVLDVADIDDLWDFVDRWEAAGARFPHVYPPDVLIGDVPAGIEKAVRGDDRVRALYRNRKGEAGSRKAAPPAGILIDSWTGEVAPETEPPSKEVAPFDELLLGPAVAPGIGEPEEGFSKTEGGLVRKYGSAFGASMIQTSELLMGKVAVGVFLPDGVNGHFSDAEVGVVYGKVRGAMDFWAGHVPYPGVRFVYDLHANIPCSRNFHTTPPHLNNKEWAAEQMAALGYDLFLKSTEYGPVYEYLDSLRIHTRSEWGIVFFIPKVTYFPGANYTAYAYLGGPFLVVPSGTNGRVTPHGTGSMDLSHLIIHESGHLFWALDEYAGGGTSQPCHMISGYLAIQNKNSLNHDYTCEPHVPCAMDIPAANVCAFTLGQTGNWDQDENGIPEVLDTHPFVYVDTLPDTITTVEPEIRGIAAEIPVPNQAFGGGSGAAKLAGISGSRPDITFNSIEHLIYRIDEMTDEEEKPLWLYADPPGGWGGDSTRVHFTFVPDSLTGGVHTIRIRAVNTVENQSTWGQNVRTLFVKAIALHDFTASPDYDGRVRLSYRTRGEAFGAAATLYRRNAAGEERVIASFTLADDAPAVLYDGEPRPGEPYLYRLVATALGETWEWDASVLSPAPIRRGEHISLVTPNPFRSSTMISILVPRGDPAERRPGGGGKPGEGTSNPSNPAGEAAPQLAESSRIRYQLVRVELDIFDVSGRRVRHFPPVHSYEGFYAKPYLWDGTNDSGREVAQGVYFARMKAGDDVRETRKIVLIR